MINPLRTLGPVNDFANDTTIAYTLQAGELVRVGETVIIAVGTAGSGGAWVASAADTKANVYTVDGIDQATGSALVGVVSCTPTTALGPGDTITVTLNLAATVKRFFARIVNGVAPTGRVDVVGVNGLGGAGSATPSVTTGETDGVGSAPTTDPNDYAFVVTVWNGSSTLTEDSGLSELNSGHFDNAATAQTKQMAVAERVLTTATAKTYQGTLSHVQPWSMIIVTYKPQASSGSATLGPHHATGAANTIGYTLAAGEAINAGDTAIVHVGAAGAAGSVIASIADSQGNAYTVDDTNQNGTGNGGAAASIGSGLIQTALHAGDTITATFVGSPPNRNILIRIVSGLVTAGRVDKTSSDSTTGTSPSLTTGIEDGVGAPVATSQGAEYGAVCLVWDGGVTLTEDAGLTSVWKGHFDYAGGPQTKQMAVSEHQFSTASVKTFTDTLNVSTAYAIVLVTYKVQTSLPPGQKLAPSGLSGRDLSAPPGGYQGSYSNMMFDTYWDVLQPTKADGVTPVNENALDATEITRITGILDHLAGLTAPDGGKYTGSMRLFAGFRSPAWLIKRVGSFHYKDPAGSGHPVVVVPKFWTTAYLAAWDNLMTLMASHWDGHPALVMLQLANAMTFYAEELIRHLSAPENRAEMVGGGFGWNPATGGTGTTYISPAASANYSDAANQAAIRHGLDTHAAKWPNTPASISYNPYDQLLSQAEAQVVQPGIVYGTPHDNQVRGSDIPTTKQLIDYHVATLFPTNRCVLENNSVRASYFTAGGALITTTQMGQMYAYMVSKAVPLYYQLAGSAVIGTDAEETATLNGTVGALKANAIEPTKPSGTGVYSAANLATWDAALRGNPIPIASGGGGGGGGNAHAPASLTNPRITIHTGTGYQPGTVLRTTMGTWDGGDNGVDHYTPTWYRVNPATGVRTVIRGPTTYGLPGATDDYTIAVGDINDQIQVDVVADNIDGASTPPASSSRTPTILSPAVPAPVNAGLPIITPTAPQPGQEIAASTGVWTNGPISFTYLFEASADLGATWSTVQATSPDNTYTTLSDATQEGWIFRVTVVANNGSDSAPATSAPTSPLTGLPPIINPFGGPVDLPGWAYGANIPAWLRVNGVEIANWARTHDYLSAGLAGDGVTIGMDCTCGILYDPDSTGTDSTFIDPVTDRAPWYDPQRSESVQFLGIIVNNVGVAPQTSRSSTVRPGQFGGSNIGAIQSGGMQISVSATLVAASKSGADYGMEWLRGVLQDPECDLCETDTLEMRLSCPPDDGSDDQLGYWIANRAAVTAGPTQGAQDQLGNLTDVSWTWTSAEAYLYKPPSNGFPDTILDPTDVPGPCIPFDDWFCGPGAFLGCYTIEPPNRGAWGSIITITSTDGVGEILLDTYQNCPPNRDTDPTASQLLVTGLQGTLIIDSSQHVVTYIDVAGNVMDGIDHLYVPEGQPLMWLDVRDCDPTMCICISTPHPCSGGGTTTVRLDVQYRRRG